VRLLSADGRVGVVAVVRRLFVRLRGAVHLLLPLRAPEEETEERERGEDDADLGDRAPDAAVRDQC